MVRAGSILIINQTPYANGHQWSVFDLCFLVANFSCHSHWMIFRLRSWIVYIPLAQDQWRQTIYIWTVWFVALFGLNSVNVNLKCQPQNLWVLCENIPKFPPSSTNKLLITLTHSIIIAFNQSQIIIIHVSIYTMASTKMPHLNIIWDFFFVCIYSGGCYVSIFPSVSFRLLEHTRIS